MNGPRYAGVLSLAVAATLGAHGAQEPPTMVEAPAGAPRLALETREIDLGVLAPGQAAEARFALRNQGQDTLRILRAKPG